MLLPTCSVSPAPPFCRPPLAPPTGRGREGVGWPSRITRVPLRRHPKAEFRGVRLEMTGTATNFEKYDYRVDQIKNTWANAARKVASLKTPQWRRISSRSSGRPVLATGNGFSFPKRGALPHPHPHPPAFISPFSASQFPSSPGHFAPCSSPCGGKPISNAALPLWRFL